MLQRKRPSRDSEWGCEDEEVPAVEEPRDVVRDKPQSSNQQSLFGAAGVSSLPLYTYTCVLCIMLQRKQSDPESEWGLQKEDDDVVTEKKHKSLIGAAGVSSLPLYTYTCVLCIMLQRKRPPHEWEWGCDDDDDVLLIHYTQNERMDDVTPFISFGTMLFYMYDSAAGYGSISQHVQQTIGRVGRR